MPTYEYQCTDCNNRFDIWQSVGEPPPACPDCGADTRKIFHPVRTIFKGSGFYITDSRRNQSTSGNGKDGNKDGEKSAAAAETKTGDSPSSDTKPEAAKPTEPVAAAKSS